MVGWAVTTRAWGGAEDALPVGVCPHAGQRTCIPYRQWPGVNAALAEITFYSGDEKGRRQGATS